MARRRKDKTPGRISRDEGPLLIRGSSGKLILPDQLGSSVVNMRLSEEGTLVSRRGAAPYVPDYQTGGAPPTYSDVKGIFHCMLKDSERDVLLIQDGNEIKLHQGFLRNWRVLIGPSASSPVVVDGLTNDNRPRFPTQFEKTPGGVVIVPQGEGKSYFFDGKVIIPLGYNQAPGIPFGLGPMTEQSGTGWDVPNKLEYNHDGQWSRWGGEPTNHHHKDFGRFRCGTISSWASYSGITGENISGTLSSGSYRAAVQWVDYFGNLSPLSGRSGPVQFDLEESGAGYSPDGLGKHIAWTGISAGPAGTIGRILLRTKDEKNSGTLSLFEVPQNAADGVFGLATLPDNASTIYPDNCPDSWLIKEAVYPIPVPKFKLCRMWDNRLWIANTQNDPGYLHPSMPGRWGTFIEHDHIYPDPSGSEITGLWAVDEGMLVFTETSTYLVQVNDSGGSPYKTRALHRNVGCVAPNSIQTLNNGQTVWLSREGFFAYHDSGISLISAPKDKELRLINRGRRLQAVSMVNPDNGEYHCWVPIGSSRINDRGFIYDGVEWKEDSGMGIKAITVTSDHRQYPLMAGQIGSVTGVWVLDHETLNSGNPTFTATVETAWLRAPESLDKGSPIKVYVWLRETGTTPVSVNVKRDWRAANIGSTQDLKAYPTDDPIYNRSDGNAAFWGTALPNPPSVIPLPPTWILRRPHWVQASIHVPSCEVFKLSLESDSKWEFLGISFEEIPRFYNKTQTPP